MPYNSIPVHPAHPVHSSRFLTGVLNGVLYDSPGISDPRASWGLWQSSHLSKGARRHHNLILPWAPPDLKQALILRDRASPTVRREADFLLSTMLRIVLLVHGPHIPFITN